MSAWRVIDTSIRARDEVCGCVGYWCVSECSKSIQHSIQQHVGLCPLRTIRKLTLNLELEYPWLWYFVAVAEKGGVYCRGQNIYGRPYWCSRNTFASEIAAPVSAAPLSPCSASALWQKTKLCRHIIIDSTFRRYIYIYICLQNLK